MNKPFLIISTGILAFFSFYFTGCDSRKTSDNTSPPGDTASIAMGEKMFGENCSACHTFTHDGIGPQLGGLTQEVTGEWIKNFVRDPKMVIESGDERAQFLFEKYKTVMPSFAHYSEAELDNIVAYLSTHKKKNQPDEDNNSLKDPIPDSIVLSDLVVGLESIAQIPYSSEKNPRTRITKLDFQPGTGKLFVVDLRGKLYQLQGNKPVVFMDMEKLKPDFINNPGLATGFGSFAFHPDFRENGLLYTTHTERAGSAMADFGYNDSIKVMLQWVLSEWKTDQPDALPFSGKSRELLRVNMVHSFHGIQEIIFNPLAKRGDDDYGLLYIGIGDGSSVEFGFPFLVRSRKKIWGSIIRIDPSGTNSRNGKYGIPENNPFAGSNDPEVVREIYAYGFRNPHRISWTRSGQILASNIGHSNIESVNLILPGHDYGWPVREGTFVHNEYGNMRKIYPLPPDDHRYNITYPVAQYDHDEGNAISGGFEYWGDAVPALEGKYLFGDIVKGRLFYVDISEIKLGSQAAIKEWQVSLNGKPVTLAELCGNKRVEIRLGRDHNGEIYLFTKPDGKIYRLVSVNPR